MNRVEGVGPREIKCCKNLIIFYNYKKLRHIWSNKNFFFNLKENEKYIQGKQELEQKYKEQLNIPKKETVTVDFGKYSFADLDTLIIEYHDDLTKDALETIIPLCEDTLDDEYFNNDSSLEIITQA